MTISRSELNRRKLGGWLGAGLVTTAFASGSALASSSASPPAASALNRLRALMRRVQAQSPRPEGLSASHVHENGVFQSAALNIAWLGLARRMLAMDRIDPIELGAYWVSRTQGGDNGPFADPICAAVASVPAIAGFAPPLLKASNAFANEALQYDRASMDPERQAIAERAALDVDGRRRELIVQVRQLLQTIGELTPSNPAWAPVLAFLRADTERAWSAASAHEEEQERIASELSVAFFSANPAPPGAKAAFEVLRPLNLQLSLARPALMEAALSPGQTPESFLKSAPAQAYAKLQIKFDVALVGALNLPGVVADPDWIRIFAALYPVWTTLIRREACLTVGVGPVLAQELSLIGEGVTVAAAWTWVEFDPRTGAATSALVQQRASEVVDRVDKYIDAWIAAARPPKPLYAAVDIDDSGEIAWTHLSWLAWKWLSADDLDDLVIDRRLVESLGRRWLVPAGGSTTAFQTIADARAANAKQIIVALQGDVS